jgi:hypothetical protein
MTTTRARRRQPAALRGEGAADGEQQAAEPAAEAPAQSDEAA